MPEIVSVEKIMPDGTVVPMSAEEIAARDLSEKLAKAEEDFKAAKQTGGFFSLFHGKEKLAKIAEKETIRTGQQVTVADLKFSQKLRPGKTAMLAGAAVVGAWVIAGVAGNKGPNEQAAAIEANNDSPQQSLGRA